jgi:hypothetical protein
MPRPCRCSIVAFLLAAVLLASPLHAMERAFWVWNRADPLTPAETGALRAAGISRLYWQAGELESRGGKLVFRRTSVVPTNPVPDNLPEIVPVVRVATGVRSPEQFGDEALGQALRPLADAAPGRQIQIDFDCPDRLLPVYAERLRVARQIADIRRLTITALAGWSDAPGRAALWPVVDEVFPMLYDVETDPAPGKLSAAADPSSGCRPLPMLDPARLQARLQSWRHCPIPWHAGLPTFARVTLYDQTGRSRGHLRRWSWEDLVFNPALVLDRPPQEGVTVLRAVQSGRVAGSLVSAGEFVAARWPERDAVRAGLAEMERAGAKGAVFFRLPDPSALGASSGGGWSLAQQIALFPTAAPLASPRLRLRRDAPHSQRWTLVNDSDADLPPRLAGPGGERDRGYALEIEAAGGALCWREALPGDFRRVTGHTFAASAAQADGNPQQPLAAVIPLAKRLTFWFAQLPARASISTGLIQLAPDADPDALRFRVPDAASPRTEQWQPLD